MTKEKALENKVAIVTGASRGLGRAVAQAFLREGAKLAVISRSLITPEMLCPQGHEGEDLYVVQGDVSHEEDVCLLIEGAMARFGRVDTLVNNAAIFTGLCQLAKTSVEDWRRNLEVNLTGAFLCIRTVLPYMIQQGGGSIINVSSSVGRIPTPLWGAYAISKAGIDLMTGILAQELKGHGIRVNTLVPRRLRTEMRRLAHPEEDPSTLTPPESITSYFVYLASDQAAEITGQYLDLKEWKLPASQL